MFLAAWNVFHQKQHPGEQNTRERSLVSTWLVSTFLHPYQSIYSWSLSSINLLQKPSKLPNISTPPHNFFPFTPVPQRAPPTLPKLTSPQQCMIPPTPSANYLRRGDTTCCSWIQHGSTYGLASVHMATCQPTCETENSCLSPLVPSPQRIKSMCLFWFPLFHSVSPLWNFKELLKKLWDVYAAAKFGWNLLKQLKLNW